MTGAGETGGDAAAIMNRPCSGGREGTVIAEPQPLIPERIFTPALIRDPYPTYHSLREAAPVYPYPRTGELLLTRYADVTAELRNPDLSSRRVAECGLPMPPAFQVLMRPFTRTLTRQMLFSDPPDHTRLRGLANRAFTPRVVEGMRARIQQIADELLDGVPAGAPFDLMAEYAAWLPVIVIAEMLGAGLAHREKIKLWSDDLALFVGGSTEPRWKVLLRGARGVVCLRRYFERVVRKRRGEPGDDLLGALIAARDRDDALTEEELVANAILLMAAGHETTVNLIGNGVYTLLRHPEQGELLRRQPELIPGAVEEVLRFESPVQWAGRVAVRDLEIAGQAVPAGQMVAIGLGAANRDPAQFPEPDRFDVRRAENRHVAFGQGVHFCLGAALARLEGQIALGTVLRRFPRLRLAGPEPEWATNFTLRGLKALVVSE